MVEVFRTNVVDQRHAEMLADLVRRVDVRYRANFDLEDCDHILRVESSFGEVDSRNMIILLRHFGCDAEILPDVAVETVPDSL